MVSRKFSSTSMAGGGSSSLGMLKGVPSGNTPRAEAMLNLPKGSSLWSTLSSVNPQG